MPELRSSILRTTRGGSRLTLIKAAPARSIELVRKPYHHSVPVRSLSRSGCVLPIHIAGTVMITGTNNTIRCSNRNPVAIGSRIYVSRIFQIPRRMPCEPCTSLGTCCASSALEASSICSSPVLPSSVCVSPISTIVNGVNAAKHRVLRQLYLGGFLDL